MGEFIQNPTFVGAAAVTIGLVPVFGDLAGKGLKRIARKSCCFVAGTLVETEYGLRQIQDIEIGDLVLARDEDTGETSLKAVPDLIRRHERVIWTVSLTGQNDQSEFFETTDDHPWWVVDEIGKGTWVTTEHLLSGMTVTTADNLTLSIQSVQETTRTDATYNITVTDFETYFVGKNKVLVHNCPSSGGPGAGKRFSESTKDKAEAEASGRCVYCNRSTTRERGGTQRNTDHSDPKSRDGNNTLGNAQNTCRTCNIQKSNRTDSEFREDIENGERLRALDE